jgi:hypothetical protein
MCFYISWQVEAGTHSLRPGDYGDLILGIDTAAQEFTGYYNSGTGDNGQGSPQFSCSFYIKGKIKKGENSSPVESYFPETPGDKILGLLRIGSSITISLKSEHGGCANVTQFADKAAPATFDLIKTYPWKSVRIVKSDKAFFWTPASKKHGKSYLVKGDSVGVREEKDEYVNADFRTAKGKLISGWVLESDLYSK